MAARAPKKKPARKPRKKAAPKKPVGRPPHEPTGETRRQVADMALSGMRQEDIMRVIGIGCKTTLEKHYRAELDTAAIIANTRVGKTLFQRAVGEREVVLVHEDGRREVVTEAADPNVTSAIFWAKTRMGWKETTAHEHGGPGGGPIQTVDLSNLSDSELKRLEKLLVKAAESGGSSSGDPEA